MRAPSTLAAGMTVAAILGCAGLGEVPYADAACQCEVKAPFLWQEAELTGEDGLELQMPGQEQYLSVRLFPKDEIDDTTNMLLILEDWQTGDLIDPPEGSDVQDNPVVVDTLGGYPAVRRRCWRTVDEATASMWTAVVDMPDAFWIIEAWTVLEMESKRLEPILQIAQTLRRTTEDPGDIAEPFRGTEPPPQEPVRPSEARAGVELTGKPFPRGKPPEPPEAPLEQVRFPGPAGDLWAWQSQAPSDGVARPAVLLAHASFGGLDSDLTDGADPLRDLSVQAYLDQGLVVMAPSWRGEHDNPGRSGWLWDEVDDLLAAGDHLGSLPYVDENRIDVVGIGYGGSLALLAAAESDAFRSVTTLSATADFEAEVASDRSAWSDGPFDPRDLRALALRSPIRFAQHLAVPTLLVTGEHAADAIEAERMEAAARAHTEVPVAAIRIPHADGIAYSGVFQRWLAKSIASEGWPRVPTGPELVDLGQQTWEHRRAELHPRLVSDLRARVRAGFDDDEAVRTGSRVAFGEEGHPAPLVIRMIDDALPAIRAVHDEDRKRWPDATDVDRLEAALGRLSAYGIVQRHYVAGDFDTAFTTVDTEATREGAKGYVYTTVDAVLHAADDGPLHLSYGVAGPIWKPDEVKALGKRIAATLDTEGFEFEWDGEPDHQILVDLVWRRRGPTSP